jgi:uncharacterized protein (DUF488 family)
MRETMQLYTIGHSNHTWERFRDLLKANGITLLVDSRSRPTSGYAPFASYEILPGLLEKEGIEYTFMGDTLGGKPADRSMYDSKGKPDYHKMRSTDSFEAGIGQLIRISETETTAIMCAEEDPTKCHRRLLLGPALEERGVTLLHIRGDGTVDGQADLGAKKAYIGQLQIKLDLV